MLSDLAVNQAATKTTPSALKNDFLLSQMLILRFKEGDFKVKYKKRRLKNG